MLNGHKNLYFLVSKKNEFSMSVVQWVAGFCQILREEQDPQVKEHMLDYLIALMEDANDFSWDAARASHGVLLCRMEQGEVKNYTETEKLDRIRRANAQRHVANTSEEMSNFPKKTKNKDLLAHITIRGHVSTKNHMTQKVSLTDTSVLIVFNSLAKHIPIRNKIVGVRQRK